MPPTRKLKVFLCHASEDKPKVRVLYKKLAAESWIQPWLDEEDLLPGQDFDLTIYKAARDADIIIICLSTISVKKEGYVNKEIRRALDVADEKLEDTIYMIPLRLDDCQPSFERLKKLHWADYFTPNAHEKLIKALKVRAETLRIEASVGRDFIPTNSINEEPSHVENVTYEEDLDLFRFIEIPKDEDVPYTFHIGKYPVTNAQYERFLNAPDFANPIYWLEFPRFDKNCQRIGDWGQKGLTWLHEELEESNSKVLFPRDWKDENFGKINLNNPVVGISWYEANAYCEWLFQNWDMLLESKTNSSIKPQSIRLPLEVEWEKAAGGITPSGRYAWDEKEKETTALKEMVRRANISASGIKKTTPVNAYPLGVSPYGVMDMSGNVDELQANEWQVDDDALGLRGGSWWDDDASNARVASRGSGANPRISRMRSIGFRVCALLNE